MDLKNTFAGSLLITLLSITNLSAQQLNGNPSEYLSAALISKPQYEITSVNNCQVKGKSLRNAGIGLFAFGVAAIGGGIAMVAAADGVTYYRSSSSSSSSSSSGSYNSGPKEEGSFLGAMGALGIVGGGLATAGGIVMWHFGQRKVNRSKIEVNITPVSGSLCYRF